MYASKAKPHPEDSTRIVCPVCLKHEQGEPGEYLDCKEVFYDDEGKSIGQCCCWGPAHGKNERK